MLSRWITVPLHVPPLNSSQRYLVALLAAVHVVVTEVVPAERLLPHAGVEGDGVPGVVQTGVAAIVKSQQLDQGEVPARLQPAGVLVLMACTRHE